MQRRRSHPWPLRQATNREFLLWHRGEFPIPYDGLVYIPGIFSCIFRLHRFSYKTKVKKKIESSHEPVHQRLAARGIGVGALCTKTKLAVHWEWYGGA